MGRWWKLEQRGHPSAVTHRKWKVHPSQVPSGHLLGRDKKGGSGDGDTPKWGLQLR